MNTAKHITNLLEPLYAERATRLDRRIPVPPVLENTIAQLEAQLEEATANEAANQDQAAALATQEPPPVGWWSITAVVVLVVAFLGAAASHLGWL